MLKSGKSSDHIPWSRVTSASSSADHVHVVQSRDCDTGEGVDDPDYVAPPTYQSSFGDALSSALSQLEGASVSSSQPSSRAVPKSKKGKGGKKSKKILLFSTAGQHHQ